MMEKKIRSSAEKITMPDELRERILDKCAEMEKSERSGNGTYTDHVFTVERAQPHRIRRVVSGLAACAVLAGGLGATGVFLHRQGSGNIASEVAQEACYVLCPFGDFTQRDYVFCVADENDEVHEYENNAELADLLNKFNWGEETDPRDITEDPEVYMVTWQDSENHYHLTISSDGTVKWGAYPNVVFKAAGHEDEPIEPVFTRYYSIDYNEFDSRVREILSAETVDEPIEQTEEAIQAITDDMTQKMTLAAYDESYNAVLSTYGDIVSDDGTQHDLDIQRQDMTDAMMYGLADWMLHNSDIYTDSRSGKVLFKVSVDQGDNGVAAFTFFEEGFYSYAVTNEDGTENVYIFNGDCNEALDILESAMDTEKKHTEDNSAYYLPGFNFVKMGIGESEEICQKLQNAFYGYDWQAHAVNDVDTDTLEVVYNFAAAIGGENGNNIRVVEVCKDGYIHMCDYDSDHNKVHPEDEKVYKFNNDDILNAVSEIYGGDVFEEKTDFDWIKGATAEYYIESTGKGGTLTAEQSERIWEVLRRNKWETEDIDRADMFNYGNIRISFDQFRRSDEDIMADVLITDQGYIIVNALADAPVEVLATRVYKSGMNDIEAKIAEIFE
ncbi:MAG: hypothetical protein J5926_05500 [Ruminococcus sp.]|nr:hypothetical protein [Ruminococcus sp.]